MLPGAEATLGGVYSVQSQEMQLPSGPRALNQLQSAGMILTFRRSGRAYGLHWSGSSGSWSGLGEADSGGEHDDWTSASGSGPGHQLADP
ncbi:hypothetical protein [Enterobacter phage 04_vB_Eclo_IJM]|nr:hypothetical protein [Enterobacter phage 04_vB_Eclo_IJM]